MALTAAQVKGRIKKLAQEKSADARVLLRICAMERFLERVANSNYKENCIHRGPDRPFPPRIVE